VQPPIAIAVKCMFLRIKVTRPDRSSCTWKTHGNYCLKSIFPEAEHDPRSADCRQEHVPFFTLAVDGENAVTALDALGAAIVTLPFEDLDELCSDSFRQFVTSAVVAITHAGANSDSISTTCGPETGDIATGSFGEYENLAELFAIEWGKADEAHKERNATAELDADFAYALALQEEEDDVEGRRGSVGTNFFLSDKTNVPMQIDPAGFRLYKDELADPHFLDRNPTQNILKEQVAKQFKVAAQGVQGEGTCRRKDVQTLIPDDEDPHGRGRFNDAFGDIPEGCDEETIEYRRKSIRKLVADMIYAGWRPLPVSSAKISI